MGYYLGGGVPRYSIYQFILRIIFVVKSWVSDERIKVFVVICVKYLSHIHVSLSSGMEACCLCGHEFVRWGGGGELCLDMYCGFVGDDVHVWVALLNAYIQIWN